MNIERLMFNKITLISLFIIIAITVFMHLNNKDRILNEFSSNLYKYPLPPKTIVLEKTQGDGKNWIDGGGNGGYWNVGATMKLSTKLTKENILNYYKNLKFPYPKSNKVGVALEIYFEDNFLKIDYKRANREGFYYRSKKRQIYEVNTYFNENDKLNNLGKTEVNTNQDLIYVIQILSGYDYFLNLD